MKTARAVSITAGDRSMAARFVLTGLLALGPGFLAAQPPPPPEAAPSEPPVLAREGEPPAKPAPPRAAGESLVPSPTLATVGGAWVSQGPAPISNGQVEGITGGPVVGAVQAVVAHPTDPNTLWIGTVNGGIWKTSDARSASPTWTPQTDFTGSLAIGALELDPTDASHNTLLAGIGRFSSFGTGGPRTGLLRSTDGGDTWTPLNGGGVLAGKNLIAVAARGSVLVVAINTADTFSCPNIGIFRSTDTGGSFVRISAAAGSGLPGGDSFDLAGDPTRPQVLYTAIHNASVCSPGTLNGIYRSDDTGATWTRVTSAAVDTLVANNSTLSKIEVAVGQAGEVYAAIVVSGRLAGLFRSEDLGLSWTALDLPQTTDGGVVNGIHPGGQGALHLSLVPDPANAHVLYIAGDRQPSPFPNALGALNFSGRIFRVDASLPAGGQASSLTHCAAPSAACPTVSTTRNGSPHADSREMVVDADGEVIEADDGGLYRRTNPGGTGDWFSVMGNLALTEMHDVAYDTVSNMIVGGNQDTGSAEQTASGGTAWNTLNQGDGGDVAIDDIGSPTQSIRYTSSQNLGGFRRRVVDGAGVTLSSVAPARTVIGGGPAFVARFVTPVEVNAVAPSRMLFAGNNDLYESFDRGDTLAALGFNRAATAMAYGGRTAGGADNPDLIYAVAGTLVFVRTAGSGPPLQTAAVPGTSTLRDVAVDPADGTRAYVIDSIGRVFSTADAGASWTNVTGNLSTATTDLRAVVFAPGPRSAVLVGGLGGVFRMNIDTPGAWSQLGTGLPNALVFDMDYDPNDDVLVASTLGRGAWLIMEVNRPPGSLLFINDVAVTEGNAGATDVVFTVRLSRASTETVTVGFATVDGTARAGQDYSAASGSLTFPPGTTSQTVTVQVSGDTLNEPDESFLVRLTNAVGASLIDDLGQGTILNDDAGAISGRVTEVATGNPIAGASVSVFGSNGVVVTSVTTDASGRFTAPGLAPGTYFARTINGLGFVDELFDDIPCVACVVTSGTPVPVVAGVTTSGIDFALAVGGRISGVVTDAGTGAPLANVAVQFYSAGGSFINTRFTDAAGSYTFNGLATGSYRLRTLNGAGYIDELFDDIVCLACTVTGGTPVAVNAPATTSGINFALRPGGRISGRLTDATTGAPLAGVSVQILSSTGAFLTSGSTDAAGNYTIFGGLPTGTYFARTTNSLGYINELFDNVPCPFSCAVTSGTPIAVTTGLVTTGIDFGLLPGGRLTGTVTDAATGAPLASVAVEVYNAAGTILLSVFTNATGLYTTSALPEGSYFVRSRNGLGFIDEVYNDVPCAPCSVTSGTPVSATAGVITAGINFALAAGGRIAGRVTDEVGTALSGVTVQVYSAGGLFVTSVTTGSAGTYSVTTGLPSGSYFARTSNAQGFVDELFDDITCLGCNPTTGTAIAVTAGTVTGGIDFRLATGGRIAGTVRDAASGAPLAGVDVLIDDNAGILVTSATTDASGNYVSRSGLRSGTYRAVTANALGYFDELYNDIPCPSCDVTTGTPIAVSAGSTTSGIDFSLAPGGRIAGVVTDSATGQPLRVTVQFFNLAGTLVTSILTNSSTGAYTSAALLPGVYFVRTTNTLGYVDELFDDVPCAPCVVTTGTAITVTAGSTTGAINFALSVGGRITGTITDEASGFPLPGVTAQVYSGAGTLILSAVTSGAGVYLTGAGLPSGTYFVRTANVVGYLDELFDDLPCPISCVVTAGTPVPVSAGTNTSGIDFRLSRGGRISGVVTDAAGGGPLATVAVQVYDASGRVVSSGTTNSLGQYVSGAGLPPGDYYARTFNARGYLDELFDDRPCAPGCVVTAGTPIPVRAAETVFGIDFALVRGGRISGRVTDSATGAPLFGVAVGLYSATGSLLAMYATDRSGSYLSAALPAGAYLARTSNPLGYADQLFDGIPCAACDVTAGTPIPVSPDAITRGIDFRLFNGPTVSVGRVAVVEGNGSGTQAVFTLTLSSARATPVTVNLATSDGTATAGLDYLPVSTTVTFPPGTTSQSVAVDIVGDTLDEADETFFVSLSGAVGAQIEAARGTGTILDDDARSLSISDAVARREQGGVSEAVFTVSLSAVSSRTVTVDFATADGTAQAGRDYRATSGTLTFPPGTTARTVKIGILGGARRDQDLTFFVNLGAPVNAVLADGQGVGTIPTRPRPASATGSTIERRGWELLDP